METRHTLDPSPGGTPARMDHRIACSSRGWARYCCCGSSRRLRSEEHTSELQSRLHLVCRLLLEKKKTTCRSATWSPHDPDNSSPSCQGCQTRGGTPSSTPVLPRHRSSSRLRLSSNSDAAAWYA